MADERQSTADDERKGCSITVLVPAIVAVIVALIAGLTTVVAAVIGKDSPDAEGSVQLYGVECDPSTLKPGSRVTMSFPMKVSGGEGAETRIWLGATLYLGDGNEVYDPDSDHQVTVVPGEYDTGKAPTRTFVVPSETAPGDYELGGEIWETEPGSNEDEASSDDDVCPITVAP
jgi:hypothetical protein